MNLLINFFRLPWWGILIFAALIVALTEFFYAEELKLQQTYAEARVAPVPDVVDLSHFDRRDDMHPTREVHVAGWINTDHNHRLTQRTNGVIKDTGYMFVLFGGGDDANTTTARAAIMMTEAEWETQVGWLAFASSGFEPSSDAEQRSGVQSHSVGLQINGRVTNSHDLRNVAEDAFEKMGLTRSDDFVYIEPFWDGRDAAMVRDIPPANVRQFGYVLAGVIALFGLAKLAWRRKRAVGGAGAENAEKPAKRKPWQRPARPETQDAFADSPIVSTSKADRVAGLRKSRSAAQSAQPVEAYAAPYEPATQAPNPDIRPATVSQPDTLRPRNASHPEGAEADARLKAFIDFRFEQLEKDRAKEKRKTLSHGPYALVMVGLVLFLPVFDAKTGISQDENLIYLLAGIAFAVLVVGTMLKSRGVTLFGVLFKRPRTVGADPFDRLKS